MQELADGIVRLGLVTWQYATGAVGLETLARFQEPLVAVVAPTHPLATRVGLTVAQVLAEGEPYHETVWGTPASEKCCNSSDPVVNGPPNAQA